jgi:hypothetical protein
VYPPRQDPAFRDNGPEEGYLIYIKPCRTGTEENDLRQHFSGQSAFPHDPTVDQLYNQDKVESYRQLGYHIGEILGKSLPPDTIHGAQRMKAKTLFKAIAETLRPNNTG